MQTLQNCFLHLVPPIPIFPAPFPSGLIFPSISGSTLEKWVYASSELCVRSTLFTADTFFINGRLCLGNGCGDSDMGLKLQTHNIWTLVKDASWLCLNWLRVAGSHYSMWCLGHPKPLSKTKWLPMRTVAGNQLCQTGDRWLANLDIVMFLFFVF